LRDPTRADHANALSALTTDSSNPTFILHLLEVFSKGAKYDGLSPDVRQLSGLIIKNYVFQHLGGLHDAVFQKMKADIVVSLQDPQRDIRITAGILIGRICDAFPFTSWSDIVEPLLTLLQSTHSVSVDGGLRAIQRICEDACEKLTMDSVNRPLDYILPCLLHLFSSPEPSFRQRALESINSLLFLIPPNAAKEASTDSNTTQNSSALVTHMSGFLQGLSMLSSDPNAQVRRAVCQAIVLLAQFQLPVLVPILSDICVFMLQAVLDEVRHLPVSYSPSN
jgi:transportin-1